MFLIPCRCSCHSTTQAASRDRRQRVSHQSSEQFQDPPAEQFSAASTQGIAVTMVRRCDNAGISFSEALAGRHAATFFCPWDAVLHGYALLDFGPALFTVISHVYLVAAFSGPIEDHPINWSVLEALNTAIGKNTFAAEMAQRVLGTCLKLTL